MTLEEKIGQLLLVGIDGTSVSEQTEELIEAYHVGGLILYGKNIQDTTQTLNLLNHLKELNESNDVPLFLSMDHEGGGISRLPDEIYKLPTSEHIGSLNDGQFSYRIGQLQGESLAVFGFNMNYAPVLDINSNPENPVIGDRSFSHDAQIVSEMGIQSMKGIQTQQVVPVVKHFPGHGDTSVDSHLELPEITKNIQQLRDLELIPFLDAIKQNADAVMIAHILMSEIDSQYPASMSETIITDLLRNDLNFKGVVITDDMTMGGITQNYNIGEASVKSVQAGSDIIMVAHGLDNVVNVFNALEHAVKNGEITEESIDEHVYRILELKQRYQITNEQVEDVDVEQINANISKVLNHYR